MVGGHAKLYDGSDHPVDSSEMAFKTAARIAYKKGCMEANPVLMEPIMHVTITVPDEYMGDIMGDMNKRRGRIIGMSQADGMQQAEAEAPLGGNVQVCHGSPLHDPGPAVPLPWSLPGMKTYLPTWPRRYDRLRQEG